MFPTCEILSNKLHCKIDQKVSLLFVVTWERVSCESVYNFQPVFPPFPADYRLYRAYRDINGISARLTRSSLDLSREDIPREVTVAFLRDVQADQQGEKESSSEGSNAMLPSALMPLTMIAVLLLKVL